MKGRTFLTTLLIGILCLSLLLAGCGSKEPVDQSGESSSGEANSGNDTALGGESNFNPTGYPIVKEKVTLTALVNNYSADFPDDYNKFNLVKKAEETTNVHIEWIMPGSGFEEQKSLLLASDDLPDIIFGCNDFELIKYGGDGVLLPLEDLIDKYTVNLKRIFEEHPATKALVTAPDGHIYTTPRVNEGPWMYREGMGVGVINVKWIEDLGLKMPTTIDEFEEVMKAFKTQDPNNNGIADEIPITANGDPMTMHGLGYLMDSFGVSARWHFADVRDGKVVFIGTLPEYKEAIKWLSKLWAQGLIDQEWFTQDYTKKASKLNNDPYIVGYADLWDINDDFGTEKAHEYYDYMPPLKGPGGRDPIMYRAAYPGYDRFGAVITRACEMPEVAIRYIDYIYDTYNSIEWIEGEFDVRLKKHEEGYYYIPDPPEGMNQQQWRCQSCPAHSVTWAVFEDGYKNILRLTYTDQKVNFMEQYVKPYAEKDPWPPVFRTIEEEERYNQIDSAIIPYANMKAAEWIMNGTIDEEWDAYIEELNKMGLNDWLSINQAAYDRWQGVLQNASK